MDFLLSRYHNPAIILNMDFMDGLYIIEKGMESRAEERVFQRWLVDYGRFMDPSDEKTFIPYDRYLNVLMGNAGSREVDTRKSLMKKRTKLNEIASKIMKLHKEAQA